MWYSKGMTFLIVEDSRPARNLIKNYLSEIELGHPCRFFEAESGEEALMMLQTYGIDFALLDLNLATKMTGLDILKEIRKSEKHKNLPVLMISGESDKANVIQSIKLGANDFIVKPVDQKSFGEKIQKIIKSGKN
jgi:two-component system chemotaxis response regulator CheY